MLFFAAAYLTKAQSFLPVPYNIKATYNKDTCRINGAPGKSYCQNKANYNIDVVFDTLSGKAIKSTAGNTYIPDRDKGDNVWEVKNIKSVAIALFCKKNYSDGMKI